MSEKPAVLMIESNPNSITQITELLSEHASLHTATSSAQASEMAATILPLSLIVVSHDLDGEGYELCRQLKTTEQTQAVPVVLVAADISDDDREEAIRAGVVDFVDPAMTPQWAVAKLKVHLELKYKTDLLTEIALLDGLTSIPNSERFDEYLDIEWRRGLREFNTLTIIYADIDHFTDFNEQHGIGAGDDALKRIARLMQANCLRAADMVARYGADEFVALLPGTELDNALVVAEKMVAAVKALELSNESSESGLLTVSVGVASIDPSQDNNPTDLINEVEELLNQAQQGGGDQAQGIAI